MTKFMALTTLFSECCKCLSQAKTMARVIIRIPVFLLYFEKNVFSSVWKINETCKIPSISTSKQKMAISELVVMLFEYFLPLTKNLLVPTRTRRHPSHMVRFPVIFCPVQTIGCQLSSLNMTNNKELWQSYFWWNDPMKLEVWKEPHA